MKANRIVIIKHLSRKVADICSQPEVTATDWAVITETQGYIEHQVHLYHQEENAAWEVKEEARIQAECDAGARALRAICGQRFDEEVA